MTPAQETWGWLAAMFAGGAAVGVAVAVQIMRSRGDVRLRRAIDEADRRWATLVTRLKAERVESELKSEGARLSLERLSRTSSNLSRLEASRSEARLAIERIERHERTERAEPVSARRLWPLLLDHEVAGDASAFAETQPMLDRADGPGRAGSSAKPLGQAAGRVLRA